MPSIFSANGLKGRRALVTGGSAGIGRAISIGLAAAGAKVTIANRNKEEGKSLADEISATAIALDVTDSDAVKSAAHSIGTIDILVNNAGVDQHNFL